MLEFDGKTIVYLDELHNGATFEGEETTFDPRKNLVLKHPLIETSEGEILMGVVLKNSSAWIRILQKRADYLSMKWQDHLFLP